MTTTPTPMSAHPDDAGLMRTRTSRRVLAAGAASALTLASFTGRARSQATPAATPVGNTVTFEIPGERVFPEGIAYEGATGLFYVGSTEDGTVFRGDVETGRVEPFLLPGEDDRTAVTGLKVDGEGRLIVCGRRTGRIFVYDTRSGRLLARLGNGLGDGETLVNDAAITPGGVAYATDSFAPSIYRVDLTSLPVSGVEGDAEAADVGEQEPDVFVDLTGTVFAYDDGEFNANGIEATPDGAALLIVKFNSGALYRVDIASREVTEVTLSGGDLRGGDGMALDGQTLWAILDTTGELVRVELDETYTVGRIVSRFVDPTFAYPTTLALVGDGTALVVNSQLNMAGGGGAPVLPFTVSRVTLPE